MASEELLLLEGIEMNGMGNWEDIAEHIGTKTPEEVSYHYFNKYIEVPTYPLPDITVTFTKEEIEEVQERGETPVPARVPRKAKTGGSQPIEQDLAGYMPKRGEFEYEHDNDAEQLLVHMSFNEDDTPLEREMKLATLHMYNQRLDERERQRKFIVENQLMDLKKMGARDRRRTKEDKDIYRRVRKVLQFSDNDQLEDFVQDLSAEQEIQKRIDKLVSYRQKGIRTMSDATAFENQCRRRDTQIRKQRRESSNIYGFPERSKERGSRWVNRDKGDGTEDDGSPLEPFDITGEPGYDLLSIEERQVSDQVTKSLCY